MKIFLKYKTIHKFQKKYGLLAGPYFFIVWMYHKRQFIKYAKTISESNSEVFEIVTSSNFRPLYKGDPITDSKRIVKGERNILFYDLNDKNYNLDIKTRWELNRLHHLPVLALNISNKSTYKYLMSQIDEKKLNNIFTNTNAMEVSISAINLTTALQIINDKIPVEKKILIQNVLKKCMVFILSNSEKGLKYSNNHYFFNLLGLIWLSENIRGNETISILELKFYYKFKKLMSQMINDDGSLYECSTHYHKYVTDSLLSLLVLNPRIRHNKEILCIAKRLYYFCCYASFNDNLITVGDNDSGRVIPLPEYFNYISADLNLTHELANILNIVPYSNADEMQIKKLNASRSKSFGLLKINNSKWEISLRCDQCFDKAKNKVIGSHSHNDQLSITALYKNTELFIDTGTYSYILDNYCRINNLKTVSHNTVSINNSEQNYIYNDWKYTERIAIGKVNNCSRFLLEGEYTNLQNAVHRRRIEIKEDMVIYDEIKFNQQIGKNTIEIYFHLTEFADPLVIDNASVIIKINNLKFIMKSDAPVRIDQSRYSPEYGNNIESKVIVFSLESDKNTINNTITIKSQLNNT